MRQSRRRRYFWFDTGLGSLLIISQIKALDKKKEEPKTDDGPRIFALHK